MINSRAIMILLSLLSFVFTADIIGDIDLSSYNSTQAFNITNTPSSSLNPGQSMCFSDVNNDGKIDLIIGNSMASPSSRIDAGVVNVILGTSSGFGDFDLSTFTSAQGFKIIGANSNDNVGDVVLCPGDLNGDNIGDIVLGVPAFNGNAGIVYVVFGRSNSNSDIDLASMGTQAIKLDGTASPAKLGTAVGAADLDNDSRKELLLSAPGANGGSGSVWVVYGTSIGTTDISLVTINAGNGGYRINGPTTSYQIGSSLSYIGDFNVDGKNDFIIGASSAPASSRTGAGIAYVIYGGGPTTLDLTSLTSSQGFQILGAVAGDKLGASVSYAGDINNDGKPDIVLGAPGASPSSGTAAGSSYVIYGKSGGYGTIDLSTLLTTQGFKITGAAANDGLGNAVSSCGDINGDNIDDFLIAASGVDSSSHTDAGAVYVIFGIMSGTFSDLAVGSINITQGFKILGAAASDKLGQAVNYAGDINQDGYKDIVTRAPLSTYAGAMYVVYGGPISYKYWDGTFQSTCNSPLVRTMVSGSGIANCDYPCTNSDDSLYWDGSCAPCDFPLSSQIIQGKSFCNSPCTNSTDYLYWDGTCNSTCNAPLSARVSHSKNFCDYPCTNSDDSLYWDGSCAPCNLPLSRRVFKSELFCDFPCANTNNFLYWNGSCISYCSAPMTIQTVAGDKLCNKPCSDSNQYYYIQDQVCRSDCPNPYNSLATDYGPACSNSLNAAQLAAMETIAQTENKVANINSNGLAVLNAVFPGLSTAATAASLARLIIYTRYLNITSSPRLVHLYNNVDPNYGISYAPGLPSGVKDAYTYQPVQTVFSRYSLSGSFFVNYWSPLIAMVLILGIFTVTLGLHLMTLRWPRQNPVWKAIPQIRAAAQNYIFNLTYATLGELFLFSFIEINTQIHGSTRFNLSLALAIICLIGAAGVLVFHFVILRKFQQVQRNAVDSVKVEKLNAFKLKYVGFKVLYDDFKETNFISQAFLLFSVLREMIFQIVLVAFNLLPSLQILSIVLMNAAMLIYLWKRRPHKQLPQFLQAITLEFILLIVNVSLFQVSLLDRSDVDYTFIHFYLGEAIIYSSLICTYVPTAFIGVKVFWTIKENWQSIKAPCLKVLMAIGIVIADQDHGKKNKMSKGHPSSTSHEIDLLMKTENHSPINEANIVTYPEADYAERRLIKIECPPQSSQTIRRLESPLSSVTALAFSPAQRNSQVQKDSKKNYIENKAYNQVENIDKI